MRRLRNVGLILAAAAVGIAGTLAVGELTGDDEPTRIIQADPAPGVAGSSPSTAPRLVVEDGIRDAEARRMVAAAVGAVPGDAVSVERDDNLAQVEVRDARGLLIEVTLDDKLRVVGTETD
ncbi:hypothetical protein DSM112329_02763 [Paraconexibacter sp. AEG42_29]|uniref:PepSY domain-containing protein n=1 Tax=Paraconexibacter sp. AEG42_29 TaxID=2997339 RepID=A0AAU7AW75_9ACTN